MNKTTSMLDHLPKLAPVDAATQALFEAISKRDAAAAQCAIELGARLDQPQPFSIATGNSDVEGGLIPLQAACSVSPQKPLAVEVLKVLLENGADPNSSGIDDATQTPLAILAQRLPQNAPEAIVLLAHHGAKADITMVKQALEAHHSWSDWKKPVQYFEATLDALWGIMPEPEKKKISPEWVMSIVPNDSVALDYGQIKRIQWLSNHCTTTPQMDMRERLLDRRNVVEPSPTTPSRKPH